MSQLIDMTGKRLNRLVVLERSENRSGRSRWLCKCDCGNFKTVDGVHLRSGHTRSCGCLMREVIGQVNRSHGLTETFMYRCWRAIKTRCYNKNIPEYERYGGRGIVMAEEWIDDFTCFYKHIGDPPNDGQAYSIDRIDHSGDYVPGNVRWATATEQARNRGRRSDNTTGYTGVSLSGGRFTACWKDINGNNRSKSFSIEKYGEELALFAASEYRDKQIMLLNIHGAGYSENHGK